MAEDSENFINGTESSCWRAFCHHDILRELSTYVNYGDLQMLRLTCRHLNRNVLDHTFYIDRTLVKLDDPRFVQVSNFGRSTLPWKHYHIDASLGIGYNDKIPTHWLYYKLKSAQTLIITCIDPGYYQKYKNMVRFYAHLQHILESPENLKRLSIEADILRSGSRLSFSPQINLMWQHLEELHLRGKTVLHDEDLVTPICFPNVRMCALRILQVDEGVTPLRMESPSSGSENQADFNTTRILRMVEQNEGHLEKIELKSVIHWTTFESVSFCLVSELTFPRLSGVAIQIRDFEEEEEPEAEEVSQSHLPFFFEMHPFLQEISLDFLYECSNSIFTSISQHCSHLRKLKLRVCGFSSGQQDFWDFLDTFEDLQRFELENVSWNWSSKNRVNVHTSHEILGKLPLSIKEIHLDGLPDSWRNPFNITMESFDGLYLNSLTSLTLRRCSSLSNVTMEFICRELVMLQKLDISYNSRVTDEGFTGMGKDGGADDVPKFSIRNLIGLKWLGIRQCSELTEKTLEALEFRELLHLDISQNFWVNINSPSIELLLENNPGLEKIRLSSHQCCLPINNNNNDSLLMTSEIDEILTVRDKSLHELSQLFPRFRGFIVVDEEDEKKCRWDWRPTGEDEHAELIRMEREEHERLEEERKQREEEERLERERLEQEMKEKLEQEEQERLEKQKLEQAEKERLEKEELERKAKEEAEKVEIPEKSGTPETPDEISDGVRIEEMKDETTKSEQNIEVAAA